MKTKKNIYLKNNKNINKKITNNKNINKKITKKKN